MFVNTIDPVLFTLGPLEIRWYGLVYVLGFLAAYYVLQKTVLSAKEADSAILWMLLGMFLGSRTFHFLFYHQGSWNLLDFFAVWQGGMSFHGGFTGIVLALWLWSRKNKKNFYELADITVIVAAFFLALGRLANFSNSEIVGHTTNVAWCVEFPNAYAPYNEGCRHPTQLYAFVKNIFIGTVTLLLWRTKKFSHGFIFWTFALLYGILRFTVNSLRADPVVLGAWIKTGHILSLVLILVAGYFLITNHKEDLAKLFKKSKGKKKR